MISAFTIESSVIVVELTLAAPPPERSSAIAHFEPSHFKILLAAMPVVSTSVISLIDEVVLFICAHV